jgi:hypothetical protein
MKCRIYEGIIVVTWFRKELAQGNETKYFLQVCLIIFCLHSFVWMAVLVI